MAHARMIHARFVCTVRHVHAFVHVRTRSYGTGIGIGGGHLMCAVFLVADGIRLRIVRD
ncbi:hypothetical protein GCM10009655_23700 [Rhodoglobus aureus]|uniref:Uncharacterized protein n=1 Tax=Rhodoglobus aureus TaxID=191497 RepID=A0ABN1VVV6_9MICO